MQLKEKPELHQINQESEFWAKIYQLYRPIKERKSVATTDGANLQPIKERKSVSTTDRQDLQPIKEPKSVATTDRQDLQPIKEPKSAIATLLKIIFIYFPLDILDISQKEIACRALLNYN